MSRLSTHVLDAAHGRPAAGVAITLHRLASNGARTLVTSTMTNHDGRTDAPLMSAENFQPGLYELEFSIGDYFRGTGQIPAGPAFLETVPLRVNLTEPNGHFHVPLLCTPWSYSTYRGS